MVDRFTKLVLTVIACALVAIAARPLWEPRISHAGALEGVDLTTPPGPQVIPRAWGGWLRPARGLFSTLKRRAARSDHGGSTNKLNTSGSEASSRQLSDVHGQDRTSAVALTDTLTA